MKAAQFCGTKSVQINQIPSPVSRRGMVTIDVAWCGTCGSDLHEYLEGPIFIPAVGHPHLATHEQIPVTMGHEFPGTVSAEGEGVTDLAVGDHVVVEPYFVCGVCAPCKQRRYNLCTSAGFIGLAGGGGGLSEEVVVYRRWVHPVGDIPLDQGQLSSNGFQLPITPSSAVEQRPVIPRCRRPWPDRPAAVWCPQGRRPGRYRL